MKKILLTLTLLCFFIAGYSQSDTLYTKKQKKITCKIVEINETQVKYKLAIAEDGPVYVIDKASVVKYTLASGFSELLLPDELSLEHEHADIVQNRSVIKTAPFSIANNQFSLAYEQVIRVGFNLDVEAGYINNSMNENALWKQTNSLNAAYYSGAYLKPGVKFFLGQDFSVKGLRYAHPLKGRYIRLDVGLSFLNFQNVSRPAYGPAPYYVISTIKTDVRALAIGGFINYGRQFILGNILTLEYYVGIGYSGQSVSYTNADFPKQPGPYYYYGNYDYARSISNYHSFLRIPNNGLSFTAGLRLGYILPAKKQDKKPTMTP